MKRMKKNDCIVFDKNTCPVTGFLDLRDITTHFIDHE